MDGERRNWESYLGKGKILRGGKRWGFGDSRPRPLLHPWNAQHNETPGHIIDFHVFSNVQGKQSSSNIVFALLAKGLTMTWRQASPRRPTRADPSIAILTQKNLDTKILWLTQALFCWSHGVGSTCALCSATLSNGTLRGSTWSHLSEYCSLNS